MRIYRVEVYDAWSDKIDAIDLDADGVVAELNDVIRRELIEEDVYLKYFTNRADAEACSRSVRKELEEA